ncbi:hypothetical protein [Streptomyces sp. JH34]|uniref:hypothetical protein n=1 Tax=Streptomyces sp. JH34 TaxID=2793633 RepID=UPI0023F8BC15|nr:hypothetical protein [Streptomyces sp. JH34]MDF6021335.1 hypothetical protein [Streptomyces sp. JH34]
MNDGGPVESEMRYADELTADVVREVGDFLLPRLERAARTHPSDSEEAITASALAEAVATLVLTLEGTITGRTPGRGRVREGAPPPRVPAEEERRVRAEVRLERLREDWNRLCVLAGHWRSVPGHQDSRWRRLEFLDAEDERRYDRRRAEGRMEGHVARPPRQG